ncbi:MAG: two-component system, chemotaxis family, sensor kinase CheA [Gammaproteobacteria bacterium]|jgi:two-component system chemotaxis sensor kinase CheA|nr:two-component system, chemotaxis family, sensor kinase CheA [Gammaproteobacteria bacterium]
MFISVKRHEREKQALIGAGNRLTDAILKGSAQGLFLLDPKDKILPQVSDSLAALFRRQDFTHLSFDKLIGPLVTAKTLSTARSFVTRLLDAAAGDAARDNPLQDVEVRLANSDGTFDTAHYSFEFNAVDFPHEPRAWLVRVTDITARVQQHRELEDLRTQIQIQGEVLRSVLQNGGARFGAFLQRTDASMKAINAVLKKPAREADAFRSKLEETLDEVDRVRRDAAALKLTGFEAAARLLEDSLQELRSRGALSGSDFLPLAVKLDQLYGQFALLRSLSSQAGPAAEAEDDAPEARMTDNGTQIIEAPKFMAQMAQRSAGSQQPGMPKAHRIAQAGSLESTLTALTELVAQEHHKTVVLDCTGMQLVPPRYQATIKNVAIQLIRNAVMHGVETPAARTGAGKPVHATLQLEFRVLPDQSFELHFQDDGCGLDPETVRSTAVAKGLITADAASRLRDRQAIKLIFKAGFTTLDSAPGESPHGTGMSLVRRYVHQAGGKIALATLLGRETRFKVTLPPLAAADAQVA